MIKIAIMLLGFVIMLGTAGAADNTSAMDTYRIIIQMIAGLSLFGGALVAIMMEKE
jgi:hypothetical protein